MSKNSAIPPAVIEPDLRTRNILRLWGSAIALNTDSRTAHVNHNFKDIRITQMPSPSMPVHGISADSRRKSSGGHRPAARNQASPKRTSDRAALVGLGHSPEGQGCARPPRAAAFTERERRFGRLPRYERVSGGDRSGCHSVSKYTQAQACPNVNRNGTYLR